MFLSRYAKLALIHGSDDWVSLRELAGFTVPDGVRAEPVRRDIAILVTRELLEEGLMVIGEVAEAGFTAWDLGNREALERVAATLMSDADSGWGLDTWLCNTAAGDSAAESARHEFDRSLWSWGD